MAPLARSIQEIESLIRQGKIREARMALALYKKKAVPREAVLPLANLARRANLPGLSLRLLNPFVRPPARSPVVSSDQEKAEYAASLSRIGAGQEALEILQKLDKRRVPEASLFEAFVLITRWDYDASIPHLHRYLATPALDPYQKMVAKVNLADAMVTERRPETPEFLSALLAELGDPSYAFLRGQALERAAERAVREGSWQLAEDYLEQAAALLKETGGLEAFFVRKWRAILCLLRNPRAGKAVAPLEAIRAEATSRHHWETVRDCDRFLAVATGDTDLFLQLYFGTPFASFRCRLQEDFGRPVVLPEEYRWELGGKGKAARKELSLLSGEMSRGGARLKPGQLLHRLLCALASDFYRPLRLGALHAQIYPDEYFNPVSSPTRVHQAMKRLKRWLLAANLPLKVRVENGAYRLEPQGPCALRVSGGEISARRLSFPLRRLKDSWGARPFSAREAAELLDIPGRTARRLLLEALQAGVLETCGSGALLRYRFTGDTVPGAGDPPPRRASGYR